MPYTEKLFEKGQDDDTVRNLVYLGTGRLYSIGAFQKYGLAKLTDFNRREVFVLFLNILAEIGYRVVFAVDELEKIHDKSTRRMAYFFNSYRELYDLFNKIKGHYLIATMTQAVEIPKLSQPLWGRIEKDVVEVSKISRKDDLSELVKLIAELLQVEVTDAKTDEIVSTIIRIKPSLIQFRNEPFSFCSTTIPKFVEEYKSLWMNVASSALLCLCQ